MEFNEIFNIIFGTLVIIVCGLGAFKVIHDKAKQSKSLDEFVKFVLSDKTVVAYLNTVIETLCKDNAKKYDTVEDFVNDQKVNINALLQTKLINSFNIPKEFHSVITIDNIFSVVDTILDHYDVYEAIEKYFNENVIEKELEKLPENDKVEE